MAFQRGILPLHILKCCVCNEVPWSEVFQCSNAHTLCDQCHTKVNNCPECKIKLAQDIKIRNPMKHVLDTMYFDCPFKEQGCKETLTRNKMSSHREKCSYGPSSVQLCKKFGLPCDFSISSDKVQEAICHFQDEHECSIQDSNKFTINLKSLVLSINLSSPQERIFSPVIVKWKEERDSPVFLIVGIVKEKLLKMVSLFFGDYNPSYRCEFEIDKKHQDWAAKVIWTERASGIWNKNFDLNTATLVKVPLQVLKPYGTSNGSILVNMNITGSEENIEVPQTLRSLVVTELDLRQGHTSGNTVGVGDITGTAEDWKREQNPFLIKWVVKSIAKYLSFNELLLCRELNSLWNEETEEFFWKLCPQLVLFPGIGDKYNFLVAKRELTLSKFMEIYSNSDYPHPLAHLLRRYRNFRVTEPTNHKLEISNEIAEFYDFLTRIGPQIVSLELKDLQVFRNAQDCADVLSCKYTPNLESLFLNQLKFIENYDHQRPSGLKHIDAKKDINSKLLRINVSIRGDCDDLVQIENIPWLNVLSRCPKLKVLSLHRFPHQVFEKILTALVTIRQTDKAKLNMIELEYAKSNIRQSWTAEELESWRRIRDLLRNSNIPLAKLDLFLYPEEAFPDLLEYCSKTLKSLKLYYKIPQPFPLMHALKEVAVLISSDLTFLSNVPNLVSLSFETSSPSISLPESIVSFMSLNKFKGSYRTYNVAEMEQLFSLMPNIRVLEMQLNNNSFSWVCENLPNLKELTVFGDNLDDSGIVGDYEATTRKNYLRPNITDLRELESFQMKRSWKTVGLTEKSVFQGFCLMDKLSTLVITVQSEISAAAMRALKRRIKNVRVAYAWIP